MNGPKERLEWLLKQAEAYLWRSHKNEKFMMELLNINFFDFAFNGKQKIIEHLKFIITTQK